MTRFPEGFLWGAATAAYQVEGSPLADGAGPSIWHRFCRTPGRVKGGDTGDVACDHYRRSGSDIRLMKTLGLTAYRFSVAWGRILPEGRGRVNPAGLDFYERLVDGLGEAGIAAVATLYHWDLPAALEDRGGWTNPDVASWFAEYADVVVRRLGDRVALWATLNEPWVVMDGGYLHGTLAPGRRSAYDAVLANLHLLRAHAAGTAAARAAGARTVGLVVNLEPKHPASDMPADRAAAARADAQMNRAFLDPLLLGRWPEELPEVYGEAWDLVAGTDLAELRDGAPDVLGINYYFRSVVRDDPAAWPTRASAVPQSRSTHTSLGWEVHPPGLTEVLTRVRDRYGDRPLYVTENGSAWYDPPTAHDGVVDDPLRVAYLRDHLRAAREAIARGVDLRGYFVWSLLDNLEWAQGFSQRFGIVHVDFATQVRTPKASARFYAEVIRTHGANLEG